MALATQAVSQCGSVIHLSGLRNHPSCLGPLLVAGQHVPSIPGHPPCPLPEPASEAHLKASLVQCPTVSPENPSPQCFPGVLMAEPRMAPWTQDAEWDI